MRLPYRALLVVPSLFIFILGLELLKSGAGGVMPLLENLRVEGILNTIGLGWVMAYGVLSGSPVAAIALTLFGAREITGTEALGMIAGSRFGAAFVVLLVGTIYYFRRGGHMVTVATGVLCLLVTWSVYAPATIIGYLLLRSDLLHGAQFATPAAITGLVDAVFEPVVAALAGHLHHVLVFLAGLGALVVSFNLFDRALPDINPEHSRFKQIAYVVYRPDVMLLLGMGVTCLTLSVSVSLGLLVPLSAKGFVRRENIVPYIMGANISTFLDTLVVSLLVGEPRAFTVVLAEMLSVGFVSMVILLGFYASYRDGLEWCLRWATRSRRFFLGFVVASMLVPALLMLL